MDSGAMDSAAIDSGAVVGAVLAPLALQAPTMTAASARPDTVRMRVRWFIGSLLLWSWSGSSPVADDPPSRITDRVCRWIRRPS